ncbi:MAG: glycosyltransferase family 9 protein [Candidatus Paracaedibacteraceae bacterium]|nr:glycosyltransferase family 9 protein [Candidatus Paracaedibacteraceae bacterium]
MKKSTLIIKLGALGDMIQAMSMFKILCQQYENNLTLLTTEPFVDLARRTGYFKTIICDNRKSIRSTLSMIKQVRAYSFDHIIDLQNVDRTRLYKILLTGSYRAWIAPCRINKENHPFKRFKHLCKTQNWPTLPPVDITTMAEPLLNEPTLPYALIIAGASNAHGGQKRWCQKKYAALCNHIIKQGITAVLVGSKSDHLDELAALCPDAINLIGQTSLYQLISLGLNATYCIGNDTGPQLIIAASGCPTITLFSALNPPNKGGAWPWNKERHLNLYKDNLNDLSVEDVIDALKF